MFNFNTGHAGQILVANQSLYLGVPGQLRGYHTGVFSVNENFY